MSHSSREIRGISRFNLCIVVLIIFVAAAVTRSDSRNESKIESTNNPEMFDAL